MRSAILAGILAIALIWVVPELAHADTPRVVSPSEFVRSDPGMTMAKVHRIYDVTGVVESSGGGRQVRRYPTKWSPTTWVIVNYKRNAAGTLKATRIQWCDFGCVDS